MFITNIYFTRAAIKAKHISHYRETPEGKSVYVVVNFADQVQNVDLSSLTGSSKQLSVYYATTNAHSLIG